ncbi:MAG TPA: 50S ribosomal protein L4 [bacterium]|jgi:large subunit ribosomal protein L4|nr:50S ribosomal protein L4 [Dictyoglomota bacterium]HHV80977.1 50S ribosomal protein L4 [bacterium]HOK29566.1 50S ribosomal protein L4 [bacterium]HOL54841.1 50S ribosomal protein L4 [bacterium]HOP55603.1 50S ribosomal protein L4 [bacterium]
MSKDVKIYNLLGEEVGTFQFEDIDSNRNILYYAVRVQLFNMIPKTASTRTRGMVKGGGRKPWRQKGTGRARHGSIRSPIWKGGGVVFGPHPRTVRLSLPKKVRRAALISALIDKIDSNQLILVESLDIDEPKTKNAVEVLNKLGIFSSCLVILDDSNTNFILATRNIPYIDIRTVSDVSVYDLLRYNYVLTTTSILEGLRERVISVG